MDDTISRQSAIEEIKNVYEWHDVVTEDRLISHMKNLPSAQPDRKKGMWVHGKEKSREMRGGAVVSISYDGWYCSECGEKVEDEFRPFYRFCRYCGADNQSTKRSEDDS